MIGTAPGSATAGPGAPASRAVRRCAAVLCALAFTAGTATAADDPAGPADLGIRTLAADLADMRTACPARDTPQVPVLAVLVRGSGEEAGRGHLARVYYPALARELVRRGHRVSGYEVDYPARPASALRGALPAYLRSALGARVRIARALERLAAACPRRAIVVAVYSQGAVALRAAMTGAARSARVRRAVRRIDLFGDASARPSVDAGMPVGTTPGVPGRTRRATEGILPVAIRAARAPLSPEAAVFTQVLAARLGPLRRLAAPAPYPRPLIARVNRHCTPDDAVCDAGAVVGAFLQRAAREGCAVQGAFLVTTCRSVMWMSPFLATALARHGTYPWAAIARAAARDIAAEGLR